MWPSWTRIRIQARWRRTSAGAYRAPGQPSVAAPSYGAPTRATTTPDAPRASGVIARREPSRGHAADRGQRRAGPERLPPRESLPKDQARQRDRGRGIERRQHPGHVQPPHLSGEHEEGVPRRVEDPGQAGEAERRAPWVAEGPRRAPDRRQQAHRGGARSGERPEDARGAGPVNEDQEQTEAHPGQDRQREVPRAGGARSVAGQEPHARQRESEPREADGPRRPLDGHP